MRARKLLRRGWKHSPFAMSRLAIEETVDDFGWPPFKSRGVWKSAPSAPDVDCFVRNHQLVARMELRGFAPGNVTIERANDELTIRGTWPHAVDAGHAHGFWCACEFGCFFRTVPLPEGVNGEDVTVTFTHDILEIVLPMPLPDAVPRELAEPACAC